MANQGIIFADKGWITPALTLQYSRLAVILLAYKKLRCGRALFAWTWSPITPISPHIWRWKPGREGEMVREVRRRWGRKWVRGEIIALLQHETVWPTVTFRNMVTINNTCQVCYKTQLIIDTKAMSKSSPWERCEQSGFSTNCTGHL